MIDRGFVKQNVCREHSLPSVRVESSDSTSCVTRSRDSCVNGNTARNSNLLVKFSLELNEHKRVENERRIGRFSICRDMLAAECPLLSGVL